MIRDLWQDLRYGARSLRRSPGFTLLVTLSLALGIGANTAIFSVVEAVMLRPLPVRDPGQLVLLADGSVGGRSDGQLQGRLNLFSHALFRTLAADDRSFDGGLAAQDSSGTGAIVSRAGAPGQSAESASARLVSANFFDVLGVTAHRGRLLQADDETAPGANPVVVLGHDYWQRRFGADAGIVGERLTVNGGQYTVIGVARPGFRGLEVGGSVDLWVPLTMQAELGRERSLLVDPGESWLLPLARLRPGVAPAQAQAHLNVVVQQYLAAHPALAVDEQQRKSVHLALAPGGQGISRLRQSFGDALLILTVGVGVLLLIVCLNVSHLLLARSLGRRRELSIRTALGASRARLVRQLLAEGLLLSALGTAGGVLATRWLGDGLLSLAAVSALDLAVDGPVLAFTAGLSLATALMLGLVPAIQASRGDPQQALRATAASVAGGGRSRIVSRVLLASQVAFSVVLLVGAGLLAASLGKLRDTEKGFDEDHLLLVGLMTSMAGVQKGEGGLVTDEVLRRVSAIPGVRSASMSFTEILGGGRVTEVVGVPASDRQTLPHLFRVTAGYFDTVGMTLARGRGFGREDRPGAPLVAVVNESLARELFDSVDTALGRHLVFDPLRSPSQPRGHIEIVGVVRNARINNVRNRPRAVIYLPAAQSPSLLGNLQVRALADPAALSDQVRAAVQAAHPGLVVNSVRTMAGQIERRLTNERLLATLSMAFGLAALFLVSVGLYGVIAQWAGQRTRELGVRMALGATGAGVRWLVLRQALVLVLGGLVVGVPAAIGAAQLLEGTLYGLSPADPATLAGAALAMLAVAAIAAYLPARRASRIDPMAALRSE